MKKLFGWIWSKLVDIWTSIFMMILGVVLSIIVGLLRRLAAMKGLDPNLSIEEMLDKQYTVLLNQVEKAQDKTDENKAREWLEQVMQLVDVQAIAHNKDAADTITDNDIIEVVNIPQKKTPKRRPSSKKQLKSKTKKSGRSKRK